MSETKHTPGPWIAADKPSRVVGWPVVQQGVGRLICNVNYAQVTEIEPTVGGERAFISESEANAKLIARAPEMAAELTALRTRAEKAEAQRDGLVEAAEWALAEIEGRTKYFNPFQRGECIEKTHAALNAAKETGQ